MRVVRSRDNPLFKSLLRLASSSRGRKRAELTLLDGEHLIEAWGASGSGPAEVVAAGESAAERPEVRRLLESTPARASVILADPLLRQLSQVVTPTGILAAVKPPSPELLPETIGDGLYLEQPQDPGNLGSMLRSALAAGIGRVFLSPGSVLAWSPKVIRAGMGAHFRLAIHEDADITELARRARGVLIATGPQAETPLYAVDLRRPVLWLFGNEGGGLSPTAAALAGERVRIPMPGPVESLNLGASVAVCLFEQARQRAG